MLPQNRRLRHLQGIYLRNLSFSVNRGRAIDDLDAELKPNNSSSSSSGSNDNNNDNELLEVAEDNYAPHIHQSQSTDSFRPRPKGQQRRRSTTLANISPVTRQKQLEYAVESRAADVFFSLHCEGVDEPVYISEVGERAMNFNFRFLDLAHAVAAAQLDPDLDLKEPPVTRSSTFTVKVWARRASARTSASANRDSVNAWALLLEQHVDLRALHYLGTNLRSRQFPPNCLVFHLSDGGVYALLELANPSPSSDASEPPPSKKKQSPALPTSSYNTLMKLSNLDASIQDALATREALTTQINDILAQSSSATTTTTTTTTAYDELPQAQESALLASRYLAAQRRTLKAAQARRAELRASIDARRRAIAEGREAQAQAEADVRRARDAVLPGLRAQTAAAREAIRGQRRRICEDLGRIFPIAPLAAPDPAGAPPPPPLSFRICGVALPNTEYDPTSPTATEDAMSAALGYVAQLVHLLQFYLGVPLPYPVSPFGSRSSVRDDISLLPDTTTAGASSSYNYTYTTSSTSAGTATKQQQQQRHRHQLQRDFPLFLRGGATAQYRFDYAWFLLNKDVEALCAVGAAGTFGASSGGGSGGGLRVVDIRHTLPNLKYLLYVCSAGTDEMPERKRGGVRGLWAGRMIRKSTRHHRQNSSNGIGIGNGSGWGSSSTAGSGSAGFLSSSAGIFFDDGASSAGGSSRRGSVDSEALGGGGGRGSVSGGGAGRLQDQLQQAIVAAAAHENGHAQPQKQGQEQHLHVHSLSYNGSNGNVGVVVDSAGEDGSTTSYAGQLDNSNNNNIQQDPSPSSPSPSSSRTLGGGAVVEGLPFDEGARLTLRTKGLRENVGAHA